MIQTKQFHAYKVNIFPINVKWIYSNFFRQACESVRGKTRQLWKLVYYFPISTTP